MKKSPFILLYFATFLSLFATEDLPRSKKIMESFEEGIPSGLQATGGNLSIDSLRMKQGQRSLKWEWKGNDILTFDTPIGYRKQRLLSKIEGDYPDLHASPDAEIYEPPRGFFMWVYNDKARHQRMRIEFGRENEADCWFDFNLNFKGWRTIALNYDWGNMRGTAREDMTRMTIHAPATGNGNFYFDMIGFSVPMNSRTVNANPQLPEVDRHPRLVAQYPHLIYEFSQYTPTFQLDPLTPEITADFRKMESHANDLWLSETERNSWDETKELNNIHEHFKKFEIRREGGNIYGRPLSKHNIHDEYFGEMKLSKEEKLKGIMTWRYDYGAILLKIAKFWSYSADDAIKSELESMFMTLFDYGIDQGYDTGAGLGWIHHYSYRIREIAPAFYLMREPLERHDRLAKAVEVNKWFQGFNQVYREDLVYNTKGRISANADDSQGLLQQRLLCALMMPDSAEKARDIKHFSSFFSNITTGYTNALDETFKPDGTTFHHAGHTLSYGPRAAYGVAKTHYMLSGTQYAATKDATFRLKKVIQTYYDCLFNPDLEIPKAFTTIRFNDSKESGLYQDMRKLMGMDETPSTALRMLPYSCVALKRQQNDWMITVRGHSKYVYPWESWGQHFFAFPLYLANGYVDVSYPDSIDSLAGLGTEKWQTGLDWRRYPGTTSVILPYENMATLVGQVRDEGGEYLFSDQPFCGGVESSSGIGTFAFQFKGHDKYGLQGFTGKKSYFLYENKVICIGTDIESDIEKFPVETTLFQNAMLKETATVGAKKKNSIIDTQKPPAFVDNRGTGYVLYSLDKHSSVQFQQGKQTAPQYQNNGEVSGNFETLTIDHGIAPQGAAYCYFIETNSTQANVQQHASNPEFDVLQMDNTAHVVQLKNTLAPAYAYIVYEPHGAHFSKGPITSVNQASTLVAKQSKNGNLLLSLSDPDLHIYDGQDDLLPDGTRSELSIYEREWFYWPSRKSNVEVTLKGKWKLKTIVSEMETVGPDEQPSIVSSSDSETTIAFTCRDGLSAEVKLIRIK